MIDITNIIQEACDNGQYACRTYVDFKKAFDTVNIVWNPQLQMGGGGYGDFKISNNGGLKKFKY